jgi:hypothetical protein
MNPTQSTKPDPPTASAALQHPCACSVIFRHRSPPARAVSSTQLHPAEPQCATACLMSAALPSTSLFLFDEHSPCFPPIFAATVTCSPHVSISLVCKCKSFLSARSSSWDPARSPPPPTFTRLVMRRRRQPPSGEDHMFGDPQNGCTTSPSCRAWSWLSSPASSARSDRRCPGEADRRGH